MFPRRAATRDALRRCDPFACFAISQPCLSLCLEHDDYVAKFYHQPSDEVDPAWDLSGAVDDMQLLFEGGYTVGNSDKWPEWKPDSEFKARRDEALKRRGRQASLTFALTRGVTQLMDPASLMAVKAVKGSVELPA